MPCRAFFDSDIANAFSVTMLPTPVLMPCRAFFDSDERIGGHYKKGRRFVLMPCRAFFDSDKVWGLTLYPKLTPS